MTGSDASGVTRADLEAALDWMFGGQPHKADSRRSRDELRSLLAVPAIAAKVQDGEDLDRIQHVAAGHLRALASSLSEPEQQIALGYLDNGRRIGERERKLAELLGYADARSVRAHRAEVRRLLSNSLLDQATSDLPGESAPAESTPSAAFETGADLDNPEGTRRKMLFLVAGLVLVAVAAAATWFAWSQGADDPISFSLTPPECAVDVCNSERSAIVGISSGFSPQGIVDVRITTPSGIEANELGGVYSYGTTPSVRLDGSFTWIYWWDPGMEVGVYETTVTDRQTGRSVTRTFEFLEALNPAGGKSSG